MGNYDNGCVTYGTALTDDSNGADFQLMLKTFSSIEPSFAATMARRGASSGGLETAAPSYASVSREDAAVFDTLFCSLRHHNGGDNADGDLARRGGKVNGGGNRRQRIKGRGRFLERNHQMPPARRNSGFVFMVWVSVRAC